MIRRPPRSTQSRSSAASDVYKRQIPNMPDVHEAELAPCPSARTQQIFPEPLRSSRPHTGDGICVEVYRARDLNLVAVHSEHVISLQLKGSGDLPQHVAAHGWRVEIRAGNSIN